MKKLYTVFCLAFTSTMLNAQLCPVIYGAVINSCNSDSANREGLNELVAFRTTESGAVSNYTLSYGSVTPPADTASGVLSGATARTKNGIGVITAVGGCTITYVTSGSTVIPALAPVVFIPSNFTTSFDVTPLCTTGTAYVVLIDITNKTINKWSANGTLANTPTAARYLQMSNGVNSCAAGIRSYTNGWTANEDGNFVAWDLVGTPTYKNFACVEVILPLKLSAFSAIGVGKNANIAWQTVTETNTKQFEVQRSANGTTFETIGTFSGAGNSTESKNYTYTDIDIPAGVSYYRLLITDKDGVVSYSKIVKVTSSRDKFLITNVYPKPAISHISVTYNSPRAGSTTANIFDFAGRMLLSKKLSTASGMNYDQLQVSQLPKGEYLLKMTKDGESVVTKFTKQ